MIVTKGLGKNSTLITRGYGISKIIEKITEFFTSIIMSIREYSTSEKKIKKL